MRELLQRLFSLTVYPDPNDRRRAASLYLIAVLIAVGSVAAGVDLLMQTGSQTTGTNIEFLLRAIAAMGVALTLGWLVHSGRLVIAGLLLLGAWFAFIVYVVLRGQAEPMVGAAWLMAGVSIGALYVGPWTIVYTGGFTGVFIPVTLSLDNKLSGEALRATLTTLLAVLIVHCLLMYTLSRMLNEATAQTGAAKTKSEARTSKLAQAGAIIIQRLLQVRLDLPRLLEESARLIKENFPDINDAQVFLVDDERKNASLVASTNAEARLALGRQVGVGSLGAVGRVTVSAQVVVVRDNSDEQTFRRAAFLDGTRVEVVLPLRVEGEAIGALDLQSQNPDAFSPVDIALLEGIAEQIAALIDSARAYGESQAQLTEFRRQYEMSSASLREIERLNQQLTGGAWAEYLHGTSTVPAYTIDLLSGRVEDAAERTSTLSEAIRRNHVVVRGSALSKVIALPISVRGQVIGAMEFELTPDQFVGPEQLVILQQLVERLGLAAENIRLLDEAQRIAQREAMVNEITARMQAATSVESVVAAATQSLADAFQSGRVAIRLGVPGNPGSTTPAGTAIAPSTGPDGPTPQPGLRGNGGYA